MVLNQVDIFFRVLQTDRQANYYGEKTRHLLLTQPLWQFVMNLGHLIDSRTERPKLLQTRKAAQATATLAIRDFAIFAMKNRSLTLVWRQ